jgi:integrase
MRKAMLNFTYSQRKGVEPNERATIFCRVTCGRKLDLNFSTELKIEPKLFNAAKGRCEFPEQLLELFNDPVHGKGVKSLIDLTIDEKLDELEFKIGQIQTVCDMDGLEFNLAKVKQWLSNRRGAKSKSKKLSYFSEYVDMFIDSVSRDDAPRMIVVRGEAKVAAKSTVSRYKLTYKRFGEYEEDRKSKLTFVQIDRHFRADFLQWLQGKGYSNNNTLYEHVKNIRRFAKLAEFDGYTISPDIHSKEIFASLRQKNVVEGQVVKETYVTTEEQRILLDLDLSATLGLENGRDIFIILCQTGLRISDLKDSVIGQLHSKTATVEVKKTGGSITIPVLPMVKEIMDARTPRALSRSALNRYIKQVGKLAGFDTPTTGYKLVGTEVKRKEISQYPRYTLMSSHTGRRSFATNALKDGVPASLICQITGHSTESMLYKYLKITPKESAEQFSAFYENRSSS